MSEPNVVPGDLKVTRLLSIFAVLAVVFVAVLAIPPARSWFTQWRDATARYNELAVQQGKAPVAATIGQVWNPKLGVVDRCTSCHIGMGEAGPLVGHALFGAHPPLPHETGELGCTICHGGQGRATDLEGAHGHAKHWDHPLLERPYFEAGCGTCHTHVKVASELVEERGEALFRRYDCQACHRLAGVGGVVGPELSYAGMRGYALDWHTHHLDQRDRQARQGGPHKALWQSSYGPVPAEHVALIDEFLRTRVGAPRLMAGKTLAHRLGCRSCHKINGVGGDDGPDLSNVGHKAEADLDYSGVRGAHTLSNWLHEHFLDPARVVADSAMPDLALTPDEAQSLTLYMLSLRAVDVPEAYWPQDRVRGVRLREREFPGDGKSLFAVFCAGCHGEAGRGRRFAGMKIVFPAIGNADFLAIASDEYLRQTITHGRAGRRMPAWGEKEGGLRPGEIEAILGYLRSLAPGTPEPAGPALPAGDAARGEPLYARYCAGCHGADARNGEAPAIAHPAFLAAASDDYIALTVLRGRTGTSMRHFSQPTISFPVLEREEVADIVAWLRRVGAAQEAASR